METQNNILKKFYFCPKCHKRILPPAFLGIVNIKTDKGITINCADPKCKGHIKIKTEKPEESSKSESNGI